MSHPSEALRAYVLAAGTPDDQGLRAAIDAGCPDCAAELAQAEAEVAALALALPPVTPRPELRARVLARLAAEQTAKAAAAATAVTVRATTPTPTAAPLRASSQPAVATRPTAQEPTRSARPRTWLAVVGAGCLALGLAFSAVQGRQSAALAERLAAAESAKAAAEASYAARGTELATAQAQLSAAETAKSALREALASSQGQLVAAETAQAATRGELSQLQARLNSAEVAKSDVAKELAAVQAQLALVHAADLAVVPLSGGPAQPGAAGRLLHDRTNHRWLISLRNLAPAQPGRCYELWFITADGKKIASETFQPDAAGGAELLVALPVGLNVTVAAVTDEPVGGVAVPTGQVQVVGKLN